MADRLKEAREAKDVTQKELADRCEVSRMTVYRWETDGLPESRFEQVADALGVRVEDLRTDTGDGQGRVVGSKDAADEWLNAVMTADLDRDVKMLTSYLVGVLNQYHWVVSIDPASLADETNEDLEWVRAHWDDMLETEFVERIGPAEYVLRLVIPDDE